MMVRKISTLTLWFLFNFVGFILIYSAVFDGTALSALAFIGALYALGMTAVESFIYHKYQKTDI